MRRAAGEVAVGDAFGPVGVSVDRARLVAYAAASGDHNRIHWDEAFARSVGLPDVIAHGMWTMGAAAGVLADWAGDPTAVVGYRTKFTAPVVVPREVAVRIEVSGAVTALHDGDDAAPPSAVVALTVTCGGEQVLSRAQANVRLASGGSAAQAGGADV